ncbi:hypothetical protein, partial [Pseudomonas sp. FSL R10-1339]|uniref:hypothetical protein n=1 Tax=Pseudomonas sp. FSL R10-1339 TaxID=2662196 RepID=UPI001C49C65D
HLGLLALMAVYFTENRISWVYVQSLARIRKTQVTDSPEMSTMPHRTSTLNDPHTELAYKI